MQKVRRSLIVVLLLLGFQALTYGGVYTYAPWTNDADSGISSSKTYTHIINLTDREDIVTVNGVEFVNSREGDNVEQQFNLEAANWSNAGQDDGTNVSGDSDGLNIRFHYQNTRLTLKGLTPGQTYELSLFSYAWEDEYRAVILDDSRIRYELNQSEYGDNNGIIFTGIYIADENGEYSLELNADFHFCAFTNCEYSGALPIDVAPTSPADYIAGTREETDIVLEWIEGIEGSLTNPEFEIYMDPNSAKVAALDPAALVGPKQSEYSFDPDLDPNAMYYWAVATYNNGESTPSLVTEVRGFETVYEFEHVSHVTWTDDSNSGISVGKFYTHKVNYNANEAASTYVNGVLFDNDSNRSGLNWSLDGAGSSASGSHHVLGDGGTIVSTMYYNIPAELTISGLTPGVEYVFTQYTRGWGNTGGRLCNMTTNIDVQVDLIDGNLNGDGNGDLIQYAYTAPASGKLVVTYDPLNTADSWHHYGFSNEIATAAYIDPAILPGANVDANVELSWELVGEASAPSFNIIIATDEALTQNVISASTGNTSYMPSLNDDTIYYWQVEIVEGGVITYSSPVWDFITAPPTPATKVIEWKFDETSGTQALQTAGTPDAVGTLVGFNDSASGHIAGLVNNGLNLNGIDEYVDVSNANVYMPTDDGENFAISGYVCTFGHYGPLFSMRNDATENPIIDIAIGANGVTDVPGQICVIVRGDAGGHSSISSGVTINDGRWHNFILTRIEGIWKLYVDGTERGTINGAATGDVSLNMLGIGTSLYWLASDWEGSKYYRFLDGIIDEYTVWEGELLDSQIAELASVVPSAGDATVDTATDMDDLEVFTGNWLASNYTDVQSTLVIDNMESYLIDDPNAVQDPNELVGSNWEYVEEVDYADLELAVVSDEEYGNVLKMDYVFADGNLHGHVPVKLQERGVHAAIYDQVDIRIKKPEACELTKIIIDFKDGRTVVDPQDGEIYDRGRSTIDISEVEVDQWIVVSGTIPTNYSMSLCRDLYQVMVSVENPDESVDTGTIYIDSIELSDSTENCVLEAGEMFYDYNSDCMIDLNDYVTLATDWLNGAAE